MMLAALLPQAMQIDFAHEFSAVTLSPGLGHVKQRASLVLGQFASPYFVARSSAGLNVHPRTPRPADLARALSGSQLDQHRAQIDPLPARRAPSPVSEYATAWISAEVSKPVTSGRVMTARVWPNMARGAV